MRVLLRPYVEADARLTADIFLDAIRGTAAADYGAAQIAAWAQVDDLAAWARRRARNPTWIAMADDRAAGFADLTATGLVDMMFVHPAFGRMGIASSLLDKIETEARRQNLDRLTTEASRTARGFFQAKGFEVITPQMAETRGQLLENFLMRKHLL